MNNIAIELNDTQFIAYIHSTEWNRPRLRPPADGPAITLSIPRPWPGSHHSQGEFPLTDADADADADDPAPPGRKPLACRIPPDRSPWR